MWGISIGVLNIRRSCDGVELWSWIRGMKKPWYLFRIDCGY
jgi:hypothetical protein